MPGKIYLLPHITRRQIQANPKTLFVFGDDMVRLDFGGQAREMRNEPNSIGIPTKWSPGTHIHDYFINPDLQRADVRGRINQEFEKLEKHLLTNGDIVFPKSGIGTGLSQLETRAPEILRYIENRIRKLYEITES